MGYQKGESLHSHHAKGPLCFRGPGDGLRLWAVLHDPVLVL